MAKKRITDLLIIPIGVDPTQPSNLHKSVIHNSRFINSSSGKYKTIVFNPTFLTVEIFKNILSNWR